uniref:Cytochrome c oxidase subunit 2 n=1 Tax=Tigriopus californicus TaxID=6832 RepID=Q7Y7Z6_TIGCA|nr:cytochrome c oxidase subunit 2 [Tigriopus californicus]AAP49402.1 cytochrome c oxidase subunit 2 [Tigriopus californicus]AAP49403.1 cytochrome c oxidase subunit 2 [Tigriopus californicus]
MVSWGQLGFQDAGSYFMEEFIYFHDFTMMIILGVLSYVVVFLILGLTSGWVNSGFVEGQLIEFLWTIFPALILVQIAFPSLLLLYLIEDFSKSFLVCKVIGHQWFWTYEISTESSDLLLTLDCYMLPRKGAFGMRLLMTDEYILIPVNVPVRILVTSDDVIHSWTIPSLGIKADAVPGRLNQLNLTLSRKGMYYGQCSEICGANHSFMPIMLLGAASPWFFAWLDRL